MTMTIRKDITIAVEASEVMQALSRGRRDATWMVDATRTVLDQARELFDPTIVFAWVAVTAVTAETVLVHSSGGNSTALRIGPNVNLLSGAREALVSVNSIGQRLDEAVRALNRKGEALSAYLLDCVGVVALSKVADVAARMAEARARERGWGVGDRLGPGSLRGWSVEHQAELCGLLPLAEAGISLTDSGLIVPFKSASSLIGIGPDFKSSTVGSVCSLCTLRESCWRRRE
jgi:hypothetical protein